MGGIKIGGMMSDINNKKETIYCEECDCDLEYNDLLVPIHKDSIGRCPSCRKDIMLDTEEPEPEIEQETNDVGSITLKINRKIIGVIVVAILGFGWNKLESCSNQKLQSGIGDKMFIHFQSQINDLKADNAACYASISNLQEQIDSISGDEVVDKLKPNPTSAASSPDSLSFVRSAPNDFDEDFVEMKIESDGVVHRYKKPTSYKDIVNEVQMEQRILPIE